MTITRKKLITIILLFISLFIILVPSSEAASLYELEPGSYLTQHNTKSCTYFTANWTVTLGDPIDVFFLTESEYNSWNRSLLPASPLYMELGSYGGYFNTTLNESVIYYIVFSNLNGSATSSIEIESYFYNCRTIINFPLLIIGVLILICSTGLIAIYNIRKRASRPEKEPPISHKKLILLYIISGFIFNLILSFILDDFLLELLITLNVLFPIYVYFSSKYFHRSFVKVSVPTRREETQCPHHPNEKISTHCSTCHIPICERCQDFKAEMREAYQHSFRLNHKIFDQTACMDCIFKKLENVNRFLLIFSPVACIVGVCFAIAGLYVDFFPTELFLIGGIIFFILGGMSFILTYIFSNERSKLSSAFQGKS